jgi:hypothetical protein
MIKPDIDALGVQERVLLFCFASRTDRNKRPAEAVRRRRVGRYFVWISLAPPPDRGRTSLAGRRRCKAPALRRLFNARARCTEQAPASTGFDIRAVLSAFEELGLPGHGPDCRAVPPSRRSQRVNRRADQEGGGGRMQDRRLRNVVDRAAFTGQSPKGRLRGGLREGGVRPVRGQ